MSTSAPSRRLSSRRGSMAAPDPFLQHEQPIPASTSSRITIVRIPSVKDNTPPSPGTVHRDSFSRGSGDQSNLARRSSWGSNKSGSSESSGHGRGRMSFAFASFTPINPPGGHRDAAPAGHDRSGAGTPTSSGPPSPVAFRSKSGSFGSAMAQPVPRVAQLTPQQIYEAAQQAINPVGASTSASKYGYGGQVIPASQVSQDVQPAQFMPVPSEVYLPFVNRPQEVQQLLTTPQTGRLWHLIASSFPQDVAAAASISRPGSAMSTRTGGGGQSSSAQYSYDELPKDSTKWTFSQLSFFLKHATRQEAPDREWVLKLHHCLNRHNEALWQKLANALGVPPGFVEEEEESAIADEEDFDAQEERTVPIGRTGPIQVRGRRDISHDSGNDDALSVSDDKSPSGLARIDTNSDDLEEEFDPMSLPGSEAIIEPITASSLPPPPSVATAVAEGLGLSPGEVAHSLQDVREEEEEPEEDPKGIDLPAPYNSKLSSRLSAGPKDYSPRAHSPLASSVISPPGQPQVKVEEASGDQYPGPQGTSADAGGSEKDIDFTEPDPNAEPIQGIRIMNSPMLLAPQKLTDAEVFATSPMAFTNTPPKDEAGPSSSPPVSSKLRHQRTGSFSQSGVHKRTQSFGAFGIHNRSGSTASLGAVPLFNKDQGAPHFAGSFAGLGSGAVNPLFPRNPRAPAAGRLPAGISLGGGMHYTPRFGHGGFQRPGLAASGSAISLTSADGN